jgi:hypothetical protein
MLPARDFAVTLRKGPALLPPLLFLAASIGTASPRQADSSASRAELLLRNFSAQDRAGMLRACADRQSSGPAAYDDCLEQQVAALRKRPTPPDLSRFAAVDRAGTLRACADRESYGPAAHNECLAQQAAALRKRPTPPDLSRFPAADRANALRACAYRESDGPAAYNECLEQQAVALRRTAGGAPPEQPTERMPHDRSDGSTQARPGTAQTGKNRGGGAVQSVSRSQGRAEPNASQPTPETSLPDPTLPATPTTTTSQSDAGYVLGLFLLLFGGWWLVTGMRKTPRVKPCLSCGRATTNAVGVCSDCLREQAEEARRREAEAKEARARQAADERRRAERRQYEQQPRPHHRDPADPHDILGVRRGATRDEIRQAYRLVIAQYHPDRVAQLGPELRNLATEKTKEINQAYETLLNGV